MRQYAPHPESLSPGGAPAGTRLVPPQHALRILTGRRQVLVHGVPVELTRLEFDLLLFLCARPDRVHRRDVLMAEVWDIPEYLNTRTVDVHIVRLRRKLGPDLPLITTVRGIGYRIDGIERVSIEH